MQQSHSEYEIDDLKDDLISVTYSLSRFTEYTDEKIRLKFKELKEESFLILRNFPCIICFEDFKDFIAIAQLQSVKLNTDTNALTATLKLLSDKIPMLKPKEGYSSRYTPICDLDRLEKALNFDGWEKTRTLMCAELAGDFHLGDSRQLTDKSLLPFDLVS